MGLEVGENTDRFDAAVKNITGLRGKAYGPAPGTFARIAAIQILVRDCPHPAIRHALEMICVKLGRLCVAPDHLDSVIDIAGYARTIALILDEEELSVKRDGET